MDNVTWPGRSEHEAPLATRNQGIAPHYRDLRSKLSRDPWKGAHHPRPQVRSPVLLRFYLILSFHRVFPILWTLVCPLIDETSRAKFLFYATDGQRGDQLAAQSAGLRWKFILFFFKKTPPEFFLTGITCTRTKSLTGWEDWPKYPFQKEALFPRAFTCPVRWESHCFSFFFLQFSDSQEFEKDQSPGPHLIENYHSLSLNKGQVARIHLFQWSGRSDCLAIVVPIVGYASMDGLSGPFTPWGVGHWPKAFSASVPRSSRLFSYNHGTICWWPTLVQR